MNGMIPLWDFNSKALVCTSRWNMWIVVALSIQVAAQLQAHQKATRWV